MRLTQNIILNRAQHKMILKISSKKTMEASGIIPSVFVTSSPSFNFLISNGPKISFGSVNLVSRYSKFLPFSMQSESFLTIALFAVPAAVSLKFIAKARAAGCKVIDHSTAFTLDESVALLCQAKAVPSTDFLAVASPLSALLATVFQSVAAVTPIQSAEATVLQPVSSKGRQGVRELAGQTGELLNARGITPNVFPAQTAFNVLPLVGEMSGNQLMDELERVLPSPIPVVLSEAIVPVFYGMTVSLVVHTERDIDQDAIQSALISAGFLIEKDDENHELATPVGSASNTAGVVMSGLSALPAPLNGFRVWLLTDNIRQVVVNLTIKAVEKWIKRL